MNWPELPDRALIDECLRSMGTEAWAEFLRRFQPLIARVASKTIRRWARPTANLVDDLVQSTLRKICDNNCRAMHSFRWLHDNSFRGFLKVVASNVVQDHFRKYPPTRVEEDLEDLGPEVLKTETFTKGVETEALVHKLTTCLQKLLSAEADFRRDLAMFLLYYRYGLTAKEISGLYSLTIKAVENTLLRLVRIAKARCI
ncbi:MAG TPA: sigma-70 family RNA polymerase sigma factor [Candidatus Angelobacter sp.]